MKNLSGVHVSGTAEIRKIWDGVRDNLSGRTVIFGITARTINFHIFQMSTIMFGQMRPGLWGGFTIHTTLSCLPFPPLPRLSFPFQPHALVRDRAIIGPGPWEGVGQVRGIIDRNIGAGLGDIGAGVRDFRGPFGVRDFRRALRYLLGLVGNGCKRPEKTTGGRVGTRNRVCKGKDCGSILSV